MYKIKEIVDTKIFPFHFYRRKISCSSCKISDLNVNERNEILYENYTIASLSFN